MANILELHDDFSIDDDNLPPASTILKQLVSAWINEKNSPELLKYSSDAVDCMMDQIEQMDGNLENLSRDDFRLVPHQMEVNRIRYILASYHRCRLEKIETFVEHLVNLNTSLSVEERTMSPGELAFAEEFIFNQTRHFETEVGRYMPKGNDDHECSTEVSPNLSSSVFIDIVKPCPNILINNKSEEVDLPLGSRHLLPYDDVSDLIQSNAAILI